MNNLFNLLFFVKLNNYIIFKLFIKKLIVFKGIGIGDKVKYQ